MTGNNIPAAAALIEALAHIRRLEATINEALSHIGTSSPAPVNRQGAAVRTTGTQVMAALSAASGPLTLIDIADAVVAIRRDEDEPKRGGGSRYQELCRSSLQRLIERGLVERIPPPDKKGLMRFQRTVVTIAA